MSSFWNSKKPWPSTKYQTNFDIAGGPLPTQTQLNTYCYSNDHGGIYFDVETKRFTPCHVIESNGDIENYEVDIETLAEGTALKLPEVVSFLQRSQKF